MYFHVLYKLATGVKGCVGQANLTGGKGVVNENENEPHGKQGLRCHGCSLVFTCALCPTIKAGSKHITKVELSAGRHQELPGV